MRVEEQRRRLLTQRDLSEGGTPAVFTRVPMTVLEHAEFVQTGSGVDFARAVPI